MNRQCRLSQPACGQSEQLTSSRRGQPTYGWTDKPTSGQRGELTSGRGEVIEKLSNQSVETTSKSK